MNVADIICIVVLLLAFVAAVISIAKGRSGCCGKHDGCDCCCENCNRPCEKKR